MERDDSGLGTPIWPPKLFTQQVRTRAHLGEMSIELFY